MTLFYLPVITDINAITEVKSDTNGSNINSNPFQKRLCQLINRPYRYSLWEYWKEKVENNIDFNKPGPLRTTFLVLLIWLLYFFKEGSTLFHLFSQSIRPSLEQDSSEWFFFHWLITILCWWLQCAVNDWVPRGSVLDHTLFLLQINSILPSTAYLINNYISTL